MISEEAFEKMLRQLLEKSQRNKVVWETGQYEHFFLVNFSPEISITVQFYSPPSESDWVRASLLIGDKEVVTFNLEDGQNAERFDLIKRLYKDAERRVYGWDRALKQIEDALGSDKVIGAKPPPAEYAEDEPFSGDDIPF